MLQTGMGLGTHMFCYYSTTTTKQGTIIQGNKRQLHSLQLTITVQELCMVLSCV